MKNTMDYTVGNTAIQIINTGRRIRVVDVEKRKVRRHFAKKICLAASITAAMLFSCFTLVGLHNSQTTLERQNFLLRNEIAALRTENATKEKELEELPIDYREIMKKAKKFGMHFPTSAQVYEYDIEKSTAVRLNQSEKDVLK